MNKLSPGHAFCLACGRIRTVRNFLLFGDELEPEVVLKADPVNVVDHVVQHQTLASSSHANHHDNLGRLGVAFIFSKCEMAEVVLIVLKIKVTRPVSDRFHDSRKVMPYAKAEKIKESVL